MGNLFNRYLNRYIGLTLKLNNNKKKNNYKEYIRAIQLLFNCDNEGFLVLKILEVSS